MEILQILRPDAAEPMRHVLLAIVPKPKAPRLTATTPTTYGRFLREWGEFARDGTAVDEGISVRSCMTDSTLAIVC